MNIGANSSPRFNALLFIHEQGQWLNFVNGECKVQLVQNQTNNSLCCTQYGKTIYQCSITPAVAVKRLGADFVQVTVNAGSDRTVLGVKFRNETDAGSFLFSLEQLKALGHTSMPANRLFHTYQQSEFATIAGGNYQGAPNNMRNESNFYLREQLDQRKDYYHKDQRLSDYNGMQQQPVGGGAQIPAPPANQGRVQEVKRSPKPVIKSKQELERYVELLCVALTENDTEFAKSVVNSLVEARKNQKNFVVKFLPDGARKYFKLCVMIEREMFPDEYPITYYLLVTEHFTIQHLLDMIELKFCINASQQHWIIGNEFAKNKEATLESFGIRSKGAEVHLFVTKGDLSSSVNDDATVIDSQEWDQQQDHNQFALQQFANQQHNQCPPQLHCYDHQHQWQQQRQQQQQQQQQQGQYSHYTNQSYSTQQQQQQQQFSWQSQNYTDNHHGDRRLPSTHYHGNPAMPDGGRSHLYRTNNYQPPMSIVPQSMLREPEKPVRPPTPPKIGWSCPKCTCINEPYRPGCEVCGENRPDDYKPPAGYTATKDELKWLQDEMKEKLQLEEYEREQKRQQEDEAKKNYQALLNVANQNLIPNDEKFDCPICFVDFEPGEGVKLRECFHCCCKDCLHDHIMKCHDADVKCPCNINDELACKGSITEAEMRSLLTEEELAKVHNRGLAFAEGQAKSYHCKTADCRGFCFYEDEVNNFDCPVCNKRNCLLCKAIHYPEMNCKEYQEDLRIKAANDKAAQETQKMLEDMIKNREAMYCPNDNCRLIIQKKDGCDWIQCSCGTEICWVTRGPRWGPNGRGDTSGGCKCDLWGGRPCHPQCGCCH